MNANSLDLLRLLAAMMVLYSHQYALQGLTEPLFMGWNTFGGAGVTIFFFLSGYLVWTSWERDPNILRFFARRSLRIFPALWVVCLLSVFVLGPLATTFPLGDYFDSSVTWRYLWRTAVLYTPYTLPGLFPGNALPLVVNGSLWTLPVEFFCYITVAVVGVVAAVFALGFRGSLLSLGVLCAVALTFLGERWLGSGYVPYLEMVAMFWWGVYYAHRLKVRSASYDLVLAAVALVGFALLGPRGLERTAMLMCAAAAVHLARVSPIGARWTDRVGDLSYGVYIYAFPVQQLVMHWGKDQSFPLGVDWLLTVSVTLGLAYLSWHSVEQWALRFKPSARKR